MKDLKFRVWHKKEKKMYPIGYQKFLHALLCEEDHGKNGGRGTPVKRASYEDCEFMEFSELFDKNGRGIYEGDIVRVSVGGKVFEDVAGSIPDMFGSRKIHPLQPLLKKHGIATIPEKLDIEVIGNRFETAPEESY